jgi:protein TonB
MKKYMMIAFATAVMLLASTAKSSAQTANPIYSPEQVDQRAMFPRGQEGMMSFMMQNMKYPKEAEKDKAQGTVIVHFVIETDGSISNIKVPDSLKIHPALDAAAVQFVKKMPNWKPAKLNGKAVRQRANTAVQYRYK